MLFTSIAESRSTIPRTGEVLALAYPDRIAQRRGKGSSAYLLRNGSGVALADPGSLADADFLVIADVDGRAGHSRIFLAAPVDEGDVRRIFADAITRVDLLEWNATAGSVSAARRESLDAIILRESVSRQFDAEAVADVLLAAILEGNGLTLSWSDAATHIAQRIAFVRSTRADWPDVSQGR